MTEIKPSTRRFRDILSGVPKTETQPNVSRLHSWDKMEQAIVAANNYLVAAQGNRHKAEMELKDALEQESEAEAIMKRARDAWIEQTKTLLGFDPVKEGER